MKKPKHFKPEKWKLIVSPPTHPGGRDDKAILKVDGKRIEIVGAMVARYVTCGGILSRYCLQSISGDWYQLETIYDVDDKKNIQNNPLCRS